MDIQLTIQGICFEWDSEKAAANVVKHGFSFQQACAVFFDPFVHLVGDEVVGD